MSIVPIEEDSFMVDLLNLVNTNEFKVFQQRHMTNSVEAKTCHVYFELYTAINQIYKDMLDEEIPDEVSRALLRSIMRRGDYRRPLISTVMDYLSGSNRQSDLKTQIEKLLIGNKRLLCHDNL